MPQYLGRIFDYGSAISRLQSVTNRGNSRAAERFTHMMTPAMMTNERKIWEAVLLLVRRHGAAAAEIAHQEAQRLRSGDDELTCVVWCAIPGSAGARDRAGRIEPAR